MTYKCTRHDGILCTLSIDNISDHHGYTQGGPKSKPPPIFQKIALNILPTELDFFVKLKYESSTIIQSVGNKYSVRDLLL